MRIGIPRETKEGELRVGLDPAGVAALARDGHEVRVESGAGAGVGEDDAAYRDAGAQIVAAARAWDVELTVKVKELQPEDLRHLPNERALFCFQQLPGEPARTRALAEHRTTAIAFEMVRERDGRFPLLAPMSVIAGRMSLAAGERCLEGKKPQRVLVLGAGNAGVEAAQAAAQAGARVTLLTRSERSRGAARARLGPGVETAIATPEAIERHALEADLVIGAVLVVGAPTPKLLPRALVARMRRGAAIVDICIDGGGVAETSRATTHPSPTYVEEGVVHYCVGNMPAADPRASTAALAAAVLPFARELAAKGIARAVRENPALRAGVLLWRGGVNHPGIAHEAGLAYTPLSDADLA